MNTKSLVVATLLGGLTIFLWGAVSHMVPPEPVHEIKDQKAVDEFAQKFTPANGAYMDPRGYLILVGFTPGRIDKSQNMGPMLITELITNFVQALLLCLILSKFKADTVVGYGTLAALIGVTTWISIEISYWNWYSFPPSLVLMGLLDAVFGFFLAGLVIGWQIRKPA